LADSTSAETPATSGEDIDVPCSQAKPAPSCSKQAKSAGEPIVAQMSALLSIAPSSPQPP
jgi:hypothetical protein